MIKAVCFDLDGTLIDSTEAIVESFFYTFDKLGEARPPREAIVKSIGCVLPEQFRSMTQHDPDDCCRIYREHYAKVCREKTFLLPGGAEALKSLADAGLALGFATSKKRTYAEIILEHLGVLDRFRVRLGPDDVSQPKPHPEVVVRALHLFGVKPNEMVFVGDMHFDVLASRAAGVRCLCVTTGYATREELEALQPSGVYDSLAEIADAVASERQGAVANQG